MKRTKLIGYIIVALILVVIVTIVVVANSDLEPTKNDTQPELSDYEQERLNPGSGTIVPEEEEIPETIGMPDDNAVDFAEVEPQFPGGESEMVQFIQDNVTYPELSREMGEEGTVYVQFVVGTDGSIENVRVLKGVSELLDKEAVRVIKKMPKWTPGMQEGEPIRVRYQIPIKFSIA